MGSTGDPMIGGQIYADYLPFKAGAFNVGPYLSVSTVGSIEKYAGGLAISISPENSFWETFAQVGVRYTSDPIRYSRHNVEHFQGQHAWNLALGIRYYVWKDFFVSLALEHDSDSSKFRPLYIGDHGTGRGNNPGTNTAMLGVGFRVR